VNQKQNPAQVLADLLAESLDPEVFYKLVREHDLDLAPKRVSDPRSHAEYIADEALALFVKDWGLRDLLIDGMMTALKDWYEEHEGI
jgi:hypothetical protein